MMSKKMKVLLTMTLKGTTNIMTNPMVSKLLRLIKI